jgi:S1-C subfamily serine protease
MISPHVFRILACVALAIAPRVSQAQEFCVVPPDSSWRPVSFGYDLEFRVRTDSGRIVDRSYPTVRNLIPGSAADTAGIRAGDVLIAIDGFDLRDRNDSARVKGPGKPTRLTFLRRDSTFQRTLVGVAVKSCKRSQ